MLIFFAYVGLAGAVLLAVPREWVVTYSPRVRGLCDASSFRSPAILPASRNASWHAAVAKRQHESTGKQAARVASAGAVQRGGRQNGGAGHRVRRLDLNHRQRAIKIQRDIQAGSIPVAAHEENMKATCIEFSVTRAVVRMTPSWIARLFGATTKDIELGRVKQPGSEPGTCRFTPWVCPGSGRSLDDLSERYIIHEALDFRDVMDIPTAVAKIKPVR